MNIDNDHFKNLLINAMLWFKPFRCSALVCRKQIFLSQMLIFTSDDKEGVINILISLFKMIFFNLII